jgi:hypothetical protein
MDSLGKIQVQCGRQSSYNTAPIAIPACDIPEQAKRKMLIRGMIIDTPDKYRKDQ